MPNPRISSDELDELNSNPGLAPLAFGIPRVAVVVGGVRTKFTESEELELVVVPVDVVVLVPVEVVLLEGTPVRVIVPVQSALIV